jgi:hypothetical protein
MRSIARPVSGDGTIDRLDMLALFAQAAKDGTVSANEIHDFKVLENPDWTAGGATPSQAPIFSLPDSVKVLTSDVIDGDPANAKFQGAALGNLQAGWTTAQFQKLVAKWFMGVDHPTAQGGTTYQTVSGTLFGSGPAVGDVHQGAVDDCYYLAALAGVAYDNPAAIKAMFTDNGDGTFTVRFFNNGTARYVTVDRMLPVNSNGKLVYDGAGALSTDSTNRLWVALAEKAYAQMNEEGWLGHAATNSYSAIAVGYGDDALKQITGGQATWTGIIRSSAATLQAAVAANKPTLLDSLSSPPAGIVPSHAYAVTAYDATTQKFTLINPQGGSIQLTWTQITQSFSGYWQLQ